MKVYFTASARGLDKFGLLYKQIFDELKNMGYTHLDDSLGHADDKFYSGDHSDKVDEYHKAVKSIKDSDVVVLEISIHSLSMGFVLDKSLEMNKPVVCLHVEGNVPHFATVIANDKLQVLKYDKDSLNKVLSDALEYAKDQADTRFNFFISPRHSNYLDWIAKNRRVPRSVYLRNLIKQDMAENKDYS